MMSYDGKEGSFPLTKNECECLSTLCNERIAEMESDLEKKDPHSYIFIKSLEAKLEGYRTLMIARRIAEENKNKCEVSDWRKIGFLW